MNLTMASELLVGLPYNQIHMDWELLSVDVRPGCSAEGSVSQGAYEHPQHLRTCDLSGFTANSKGCIYICHSCRCYVHASFSNVSLKFEDDLASDREGAVELFRHWALAVSKLLSTTFLFDKKSRSSAEGPCKYLLVPSQMYKHYTDQSSSPSPWSVYADGKLFCM